jgi:hypothetical protein
LHPLNSNTFYTFRTNARRFFTTAVYNTIEVIPNYIEIIHNYIEIIHNTIEVIHNTIEILHNTIEIIHNSIETSCAWYHWMRSHEHSSFRVFEHLSNVSPVKREQETFV